VTKFCRERRSRVTAGCVRAAMPAQLPEMCYLISKPGETPGRKVMGLTADRRTLARPPDVTISPLGKPRETVGRKAMGAKADVSLPVHWTGTGNIRTQSQPGRRRNVICFANREKFRDAKPRGLPSRPWGEAMSARPPEPLPPIKCKERIEL